MASHFFSPINNSDVVQAVAWRAGKVVLLDQTALPKEEVYLECDSTDRVVEAIKKLVVRGAPAIGITGAYAGVLAALEVQSLELSKRPDAMASKLKAIEMARPTAVNLSWAIQKIRRIIEVWDEPLNSRFVDRLLEEAKRIHQEDFEFNHSMAKLGAELLTQGPVLTICNTGDLATGGIGTAFGILTQGFKLGKISRVFACETRPVLQGIRLTSWELNRYKIPYTIICDNMAAAVMKKENISAVITGADRIAANGDVANKIGTYALAVLAKAHGIAFYIAAPTSTFDLSLLSGELIPIEERSHEEILSVLGGNRPSYEIPVWNPSFDVTPQSLISAIICERGVINSPNQERINKMLNGTVI